MNKLTTKAALWLAVQMLEQIKNGGSYSYSQFHGNLFKMKEALEADAGTELFRDED